ncbi:myosin-15 [Trifolium repens]|nr:myosin-15 [Trifolium repens]
MQGLPEMTIQAILGSSLKFSLIQVLCASERDVEKYKFGHPSHFHYLNQSKVYELDGVSSTEEYIKTRRTMNIVGISHEDQEAIFRTLAAILHLGNVEFSPGKEHDSSIIKDEKSTFHLQMAANLFKCDLNLLRATLCTRTIQIREGNIVKAFDCNAAVAGRDVLAKTVYARLFDWFFDKINKTVGQDINSRMQIGILDIMPLSLLRITADPAKWGKALLVVIVLNLSQVGNIFYNSFEQFCINFANEKLQQHFNEKPIGIIALLDEACMFPKSTHQTFSTKLFQHFLSHTRFRNEKFS